MYKMKKVKETTERNNSYRDSDQSFHTENSETVEEHKLKLFNKNINPHNKTSYGLMSLYITSYEKDNSPKVTLFQLKAALPNLEPISSVETNYGLILNLMNDSDIKKILNLDLARIFQKPVQVVPLFSEKLKKSVSFKDVPWCIRNEEIEYCLRKQNIDFGKVTRDKSIVFVEVCDYKNYHRLKEDGINFYNSVSFKAADDSGGVADDINYHSSNIIQCYRCQGFWHTATTCKQKVRCVRCGEEHCVENCSRSKLNPVCCNCKGSHHAAYKLCPVRLKLKNAMRVSFCLCQ